MQAPLKHTMGDDIFWVSPGRVLFWENENALIVSDLHFGKTGHFRKFGIAVPQTIFKEDLQRLVSQLQFFSPRQLLVVGDLFHSVANKELDLFQRWRNDLPDLSIQLIKGNHDVLKSSWYVNAGITLVEDALRLKKFCFTHDISNCAAKNVPEDMNGSQYIFSGHIHPGIRFTGLGRQSICLPCFYFGEKFAVLPAFSHFSGTALIEAKRGDTVFALSDKEIICKLAN